MTQSGNSAQLSHLRDGLLTDDGLVEQHRVLATSDGKA